MERITFAARLSLFAVCVLSATGAWALNVAVEANPDPALPGERVNVEITVTNDGGSASGNVTMSMVYPAGLRFINDSLIDGDCPSSFCNPGDTVVFTVGSIPGGGGRTFTLTPLVDASTTAGTNIAFDVNAQEGGSDAGSAAADIDVVSKRVLEMAVAEDADPVGSGDTLQYTIDFGLDTASAGLPDASLSLTLPTDTTPTSLDGGILAGDTVTWGLGPMNPGDNGQRTVIVTVDGAASDGDILAAQAQFTDGAAETVEFRVTTRVEASSPLNLSLVATPDPASNNEQLDLEFMVGNQSGSTMTDVQIEFEYPEGIAFINRSLTDGGNCGSSFCNPGERMTFTIDSLAAGRGRVFSVPALVNASISAGSVIYLEASAVASGITPVEMSTNVRVEDRDRDLRIDSNRDPVEPGADINYELAFGSLGTSTGSPNAMLTMEVPPGTSLVSASDGGTLNSGRVEWSLGALNPGESGRRSVALSVDGGVAVGSLLPARAAFFDSINAQDSVRVGDHTRVEAALPMEILVNGNAEDLLLDEMFEMELAVANSGGLNRTGVVASMEFPPGIDFISRSQADTGNCGSSFCNPRERMEFDIGDLDAGDGKTFSVPMNIATEAVDGRIVPIEVRVLDTTGLQVRDTVLLRVESDEPLELDLGSTVDPAVPGEAFDYELSFGFLANASGADAGTLSLELPAGVTLLNASDGGTVTNGTVNWTIGAVNPGTTGRRIATVSLDGGATPGALLEARAMLSDGNSNPFVQRATRTTKVAAARTLDVRVIATPDPALPGEFLDVELSVSNTGLLNRSNVTLELEFPEELNFIGRSFVSPGDCGSSFCNPRE